MMITRKNWPCGAPSVGMHAIVESGTSTVPRRIGNLEVAMIGPIQRTGCQTSQQGFIGVHN